MPRLLGSMIPGGAGAGLVVGPPFGIPRGTAWGGEIDDLRAEELLRDGFPKGAVPYEPPGRQGSTVGVQTRGSR